MKWYAIAPVAAAVGLGGALASYDGWMEPVRAERTFLKTCTSQLRSAGVSMGEADDACDCMAAKAKASGERLTAGDSARAFDQCTLAPSNLGVTPKKIGSGADNNPFAPGRAPVDRGGGGKADPETGGWGAQ